LYGFPIIQAHDADGKAVLNSQDFTYCQQINLKESLGVLHEASPFKRGQGCELYAEHSDQSIVKVT
jgi:hypothetical protein